MCVQVDTGSWQNLGNCLAIAWQKKSLRLDALVLSVETPPLPPPKISHNSIDFNNSQFLPDNMNSRKISEPSPMLLIKCFCLSVITNSITCQISESFFTFLVLHFDTCQISESFSANLVPPPLLEIPHLSHIRIVQKCKLLNLC